MSYYLYFTKLAFRRIIPMIERLKIVNIRDVSVSDGPLEKKRGSCILVCTTRVCDNRLVSVIILTLYCNGYSTRRALRLLHLIQD